jgi:type I restriction enzyme M protein
MYGPIIGDVAGSGPEDLEIIAKISKRKRTATERKKILNRETPLFSKRSSCTDDSKQTAAIADAILSGKSYEETLREHGLREIELGADMYGRSRFSPTYISWLKDEIPGNSYGNACAMRISPVGFLFNSIEEVKMESYKATITSHNHPEAIKSAEAVAVSIFMLRTDFSKDEVKKYIEDNYFSLNYDLDNLSENYEFTSRAINSVPQAIFCFLQSNDFEDAIRKAISIGGD